MLLARLLRQPRLAKHLDLSQQRINQLADEHMIDRCPIGASIRMLAALPICAGYVHRSGACNEARWTVDFVKAKTELIAIRVREKKRELMMTEEALADMEQLIGIVLTEMSSMPALIGGSDLQLRRKVEKCVFDTRVKLANTFTKIAEEARGPASHTTDTTDEDDAAA